MKGEAPAGLPKKLVTKSILKIGNGISTDANVIPERSPIFEPEPEHNIHD